MKRARLYFVLLAAALTSGPATSSDALVSEDSEVPLLEQLLLKQRAEAVRALTGSGLAESDAEDIAEQLVEDIRACVAEVSQRAAESASLSSYSQLHALSACNSAAFERAGVRVPD